MNTKKIMYSIIAFGNPLLDIIVKIENNDLLLKYAIKADDAKEIPQREMENLYKDIKNFPKSMTPGGCAQNTLRVMQWILGVPKSTVFFGTIGNDEQGKILRDLIEKDGVEPRYQIKEKINTGYTIGLVKEDTRALIANIGAANYFDTKTFSENLENIQLLRTSKLVYIEACFLPNRIETVTFIEKFCIENNKILVFTLNAAYLFEMEPLAIKKLSESCNILIGNKNEFNALAKLFDCPDLQKLALKLNKNFVNKNVDDPLLKFGKIIVITDGSEPITCVYSSQKVLIQKVHKLTPDQIVDTVAAGDSFAAGFLCGLLKNLDIEDCLEWAQKAAIQIIMQPGCTIPNFSAKSVF